MGAIPRLRPEPKPAPAGQTQHGHRPQRHQGGYRDRPVGQRLLPAHPARSTVGGYGRKRGNIQMARRSGRPTPSPPGDRPHGGSVRNRTAACSKRHQTIIQQPSRPASASPHIGERRGRSSHQSIAASATRPIWPARAVQPFCTCEARPPSSATSTCGAASLVIVRPPGCWPPPRDKRR